MSEHTPNIDVPVTADEAAAQDEAPAVEAPVVRTFIIMRDRMVGAHTAPAFVAYIDSSSPGFEDIDPHAYNARRDIVERYIDHAQPEDVVGTWWVGIMPDDDANDWTRYLELRPIKVERIVNVSYLY